jgi:hypothetical protein
MYHLLQFQNAQHFISSVFICYVSFSTQHITNEYTTYKYNGKYMYHLLQFQNAQHFISSVFICYVLCCVVLLSIL